MFSLCVRERLNSSSERGYGNICLKTFEKVKMNCEKRMREKFSTKNYINILNNTF